MTDHLGDNVSWLRNGPIGPVPDPPPRKPPWWLRESMTRYLMTICFLLGIVAGLVLGSVRQALDGWLIAWLSFCLGFSFALMLKWWVTKRFKELFDDS